MSLRIAQGGGPHSARQSKARFALVIGILVATLCWLSASASTGRTVEEMLHPPSKAAQSNPPPGGLFVVNGRLVDNGDHDRWGDTNETVALRITLFNGTGMELTGVEARLQVADPRIVCVVDDRITVGELSPGQRLLSAEAFSFLVADVDRGSVTEQFAVPLTITFAADQPVPLPPETLLLDLDLDAAAGSGPTTWFEGFEGGAGSLDPMPIDQDLDSAGQARTAIECPAAHTGD
jgi:hypothetical protein